MQKNIKITLSRNDDATIKTFNTDFITISLKWFTYERKHEEYEACYLITKKYSQECRWLNCWKKCLGHQHGFFICRFVGSDILHNCSFHKWNLIGPHLHKNVYWIYKQTWARIRFFTWNQLYVETLCKNIIADFFMTKIAKCNILPAKCNVL